jgi:hypothetical protein
MVLHGPLADAKVGRNILAWMSGKDEVHDLVLARGEVGEAAKRRVARCRDFVGTPGSNQSEPDTCDQYVARDRLLYEIQRPLLHGQYGVGYSAAAADNNDGRAIRHIAHATEQLQAPHAWEMHVQNNTGIWVIPMARQEFLAAREGFDIPTGVQKHAADNLACEILVFDNIYLCRERLIDFGPSARTLD